jgi:hypothetical protein
LQNPLSDKKGSVFYPMAEPLKNGSVQGKMVLYKKNGSVGLFVYGELLREK